MQIDHRLLYYARLRHRERCTIFRRAYGDQTLTVDRRPVEGKGLKPSPLFISTSGWAITVSLHLMRPFYRVP